ncbi:MAG: hypothetical protein CML72_00195 [Rhodobacterales bacterium]|nr:hypothetical protein [Rhodobacterales bacterium]
MMENTETSSHSILDTRFAKLVIGKSYLGDFVRSVCVCIFYGVIILLATMLLVATYGGSSASASGAFGFVAVIGLLASVPASIVYFILLALGRALRRIKTLSNLLRIIALIWFFIIPLTVLYVLVFN